MKNSKLNQLKEDFQKDVHNVVILQYFLVILKHLIVVNRVELNFKL